MVRIYHQRIVAVHILFINCEKKVLLSKRKGTGYRDGEYSVAGGHVEEGEFVVGAAIREVCEEVGVKVTEKDLEFVLVVDRVEGGQERIDFFYACQRWAGEITNNEPNKCSGLKWYRVDKLPKNIVPYVGQAIRAWQEGVYMDKYRD